jgi:ankyrin repeat protein
MAAWGGHTPLVRLLVQRGAIPDGSPEQVARRHRPVDTAAEHGHVEAVRALVELGAIHSLSHLLKVALTPLVVNYLDADPAAVMRPLENGTPPLHLAVIPAHSERLVELLLSRGADVCAADRLGRTALHVALENQRTETARLLVEADAPLDIFAAAGMSDAAHVANLLDQDGSLAQAEHADGVTALFYAAWAGDARSAEQLLAHGAEVSPRAKRFWACITPLHIALQRRHRDVVSLLLDHGADVDAHGAEEGQYWPTPLQIGARWGTLDDVNRLLDHGADPNGGAVIPGSFGASGLTWAVFAGNEELVHLLLKRGLDLQHPNHQAILHLAAERGHSTVIRLLIGYGANPLALDSTGQTARARARRFGRTEAEQLLVDAGG